MANISLNKTINLIMFLYIISIYLFTYREGLNSISNVLALFLCFVIWLNFLILRRKLIFNNFLYIFSLFIGIVIFSSVYAIDQQIAITKSKTLILIFLLMISLVNYYDTFEKIDKVLRYFIYAGLLTSVYILVNADFSQITRFGGDVGNVNEIGIIIGISSTLCIYYILNENRYIYYTFLLIMLPTILLTGSRKALLFICINIILIIYFKNRKSFKSILKFLLIGISLLIGMYYLIFNVPLFYEIIGKRVESLVSFMTGEGTNEGSINLRSLMLEYGIQVFKNQPIIGYGIDNFRVLLGREIGLVMYAHNNFIELLVDLGIVGLTVYYMSNIIILRGLFKVTQSGVHKTIAYTFIAIIISYIILSSSLVFYDSKHFSILLTLCSVMPGLIKKED